jgi:hypothetical protein
MMGKALALACLFVAACQPMYKNKPEILKNPPRHPAPKVVITEPDPTFVDDCDVDFSAPAIAPRTRKTTQSQQLTSNANTALQPSLGAQRPSTPTTVQSVTTALDTYRQALISDPYNAEATLKLALAYDRLLRKGCALALLRRLDTLASHQQFEKDAEPMVELVVQNPHWFKPYHRDALKAVGR